MRDEDVPPLYVTLLQHGDLIVADLAETGTLIPRSEVRVDDAFLRDLAGEMKEIVARRGPGTERALARTGGLVFSQLLTEPARRRLQSATESDLYLRLDERLVHVPWELCHDGEKFLFERFRIGRQVITGQSIPEARPAGSERDRLRVLVIADPTEDLPQAALEGEQLCTLLDDVPGIEVTLLAGRSVRRIPLLAALQEHDAVHFAGHSEFDPVSPAESGWRLADGILRAAELARLRQPPFLVFSNSCEAATSTAWRGGAAYDGHAFGIGSAFLIAGVPNYVGTFWVVHDAESVTFATAYYRILAAGGRLGEAIAAARRAVVSAHSASSLTWASYLLYGDPAARPLARGVLPSGSRRSPAQPIAREQIRYAVSLPAAGTSAPAIDRVSETRHLVGRDAELGRLAAAFAAARAQERRVVFVSGPPGIGKTTLLDAFVARAAEGGEPLVAHGQAVDHYGAGEPYLPLLEALGRLAASPEGRALTEDLRRHAPTWLAQLPALVEPREHEALARRSHGSTRDRMLRELADLVEAVTAARPLILVIEDLHWSDHATIEAIAYVAQRRGPARLLIVGTFRPAEVLSGGDHPLRAVTQELQARRRSEEIRLELLGERDVERYLRMRLGVERIGRDLVDILYRRTEGHPLFLVNVIDFALRKELIATHNGALVLRGGEPALAASIPPGLLPMIERQIESLPPEDQQVLEAAAVAGAEFSSAAVVAALDLPADDVNERCEGLAWRGQFVRAAGMEEWPDGTLAGRYRFVHALYQNALYQRVIEPRRVRLHRRIAERKAQAFGAQTAEIAAELAAHFEAAHDPRRALEHRIQAGDLAVQRHAEREAVEHFRQALRLLARIDDRAQGDRELEVLVKLATRMMSTAGYAAPELEKVFDRAYALSRQLVPGPIQISLLRGLMSFYQVRSRAEEGRTVGEEMLDLCGRSGDAVSLVQAHYGHGVTLYDLAEFDAAQPHLEAALAGYDPDTHLTHIAAYGGYDPGVGCNCWLAWLLWLKGEPDRAVRRVEQGLALAEQLGHPFSTAFACLSAAVLHLQRGEVVRAEAALARASAIAIEDGFPYLGATVASVTAWSELARGRPQEAIARGQAALAAHRAAGAALSVPGYLTVLAYAHAFVGNVKRALDLVETGIAEAERTHQRLYLVGLWRARGELLVFEGGEARHGEAEASHRAALELARALHAPMLELQAAIGCARLLVTSGRTDEASSLLSPVYAGFREGFDTSVLREAKSLLDAC